jgi:hypothetical protein
MPAFISALKPTDWIQITGVIANAGLGYFTYRLTRRIGKTTEYIAEKQVQLEVQKMKISSEQAPRYQP